MRNSFYDDLELELEVLLIKAYKENKSRFITVGERKYSPQDLITEIKKHHTEKGTSIDKEKLHASFGGDENFTIFLERIQEYRFEGSAPPYVDILNPGRYVLDCQANVIPAIEKAKKAWEKLNYIEQAAFLAGLEAAKNCAAVQDDIF